MLKLTLLALSLAACGGADPTTPADTGSTDATPAEVASAAYAQHWTPTGSDTPRGCSPAFADLPAATPDCASVPATRNGCSVGCFGSPGAYKVAVGCAGCSAEYAVSFTAQ